MKRFAKALGTAGLLVVSTTAMAQELTIASGSKGGTYYSVYGANLAGILREHGYDVSVDTTKGSIDNLQRLKEGSADLAFVQTDALAYWSRDNASATPQQMTTLGEECVFIAVRDDGEFNELGDLNSKNAKLDTGRIGSGSQVSWNYLRTLEEDYAKTQVYNRGGMMALGKLKTGNLDGVLWVTAPENKAHRHFSTVMAKGSGLKLIDVDDSDFNGKLPNGSNVYEFRDVKIDSGFFGDTTVTVPCTPVSVVVSQNLDYETQDALAGAIVGNESRIRATQ